MKVIKKPWFIPILMSIAILSAGGLYIKSMISDEKALPEKVVLAKLENMYSGTVRILLKKDGLYEAEITKGEAVYKAEVDSKTGEVLSLIQTSETNKPTPPLISEVELREVIATQYTGTVERISLDKKKEPPKYKVEIANEQSLKSIEINAVTGEVLSEKTKETTSENAVITKKQAIKIAHEQLEGEVEYISYEMTNDGGYYLVEIESHEEEALFQIHAISGKILSVTWDH